MRKLNIEISKAQLTGFSCCFEEDGTPNVSATIALFTDGPKHITDFQISTNSWNKESKFDLPIEMILPIQKIAGALEHVIVEHMRDGQLKLKKGKQ